MNSLRFELCAETLQAARAAQAGGADQVELCVGLACGGITPPADLITAALQAVSIPVSILIRPRYGDFVFSISEFALMRTQIAAAARAGAAAVALGVLLPDRRVDVVRTRELIEGARPMKVTFHRAFDETPDLFAALDDVMAAGADYLLTSGGRPDVLAGAVIIGRLRELAGSRLRVMAGGGLRLGNLAEVVRRSGVTMLHGSLTRSHGAPHTTGNSAGSDVSSNGQLLEADVREAVHIFHEAFQARGSAALSVGIHEPISEAMD